MQFNCFSSFKWFMTNEKTTKGVWSSIHFRHSWFPSWCMVEKLTLVVLFSHSVQRQFIFLCFTLHLCENSCDESSHSSIYSIIITLVTCILFQSSSSMSRVTSFSINFCPRILLHTTPMEDDLNYRRPQYILMSNMTRFECQVWLDYSN